MADNESRHICGKGCCCESCMAMAMAMAIPAVEADASSRSYWNYNTSVPYLADENEQFVDYVYVGYPSTKKKGGSGFRLKKMYSTRARGRSSPLQSLARKICRFKVRTVLLGDTTTGTGQTQQTR